MKTSIIIVNHQTKDYLRRTLQSFAPQLNGQGAEIIVVDNDSNDGSIEMLQDEFPYVKLICLEDNLGFGRANNIGIKSSKGKLLVLLNSDTEASPEALTAMAQYMETNGSIGALGCKIIDNSGNLQLSLGKFPTFFGEIIRKFLHSRLSLNDPLIRDYVEAKYNGKVETDWVSAACVIFRREALDKAGLFDHPFFMYFEDVDLCYRIKQAGWKIYYNSQISIMHHGGMTARQNLARSYLEYRRSQFYFCRKYYGLKGLVILKIFVFLKFLSIGMQSIVSYVLFIFSKRSRKENYTRMLLSKKMIEMVFQPCPESR